MACVGQCVGHDSKPCKSPAVDRKLIGHWTTAISIGRSEKMYFLYQFISFFWIKSAIKWLLLLLEE